MTICPYSKPFQGVPRKLRHHWASVFRGDKFPTCRSFCENAKLETCRHEAKRNSDGIARPLLLQCSREVLVMKWLRFIAGLLLVAVMLVAPRTVQACPA